MRIYLCEDTFEGILTGVYDAWASRLGHDNVKLELAGEYNMELFSEYVTVDTDAKKAQKVARTLRMKLSEEIFAYVYKAAMSPDEEKADRIYRFIVLAIRNGTDVIHQLYEPAVMDVFSMVRKVGNEAHRFLQFIRFRELENGVLFSKIEPKSHVLTLVAPHFNDRFPEEDWVIYDDTHKAAAVHAKHGEWILMREVDLQAVLSSDEEAEYEELWKIFFHTIGIEERKNPKCQRNMLPLWYRKNMLEFEESNKTVGV